MGTTVSSGQAEPRDYDAGGALSAPVLEWDTRTRYEQWQAEQGIPVHRGFFVEDLAALDTARWDALGAGAAFVELVGAAETNGAYVLRLEPGRPTSWERELFEQVFYVVSGEGRTEIAGDRELACEWAAGSLFSVPLNRRFRHVATREALLYAVTSAPLVMNLFHNDELVFDNPAPLADRLTPDAFLTGQGVLWSRKGGSTVWHTQAVRDCRSIEVPPSPRRGAGGRTLTIQLGENTLIAHISEFPVGTYKKAHRHGPGAHIVLLGGEGYSLLWQRDFADRVRVDWRENALFVPPPYWFHQHFNVGSSPARYLAIRWGSPRHRLDHSYDKINQDRRDDGDQIEYDDQDPTVHELFVEECARRGVTVDESAMRPGAG